MQVPLLDDIEGNLKSQVSSKTKAFLGTHFMDSGTTMALLHLCVALGDASDTARKALLLHRQELEEFKDHVHMKTRFVAPGGMRRPRPAAYHACIHACAGALCGLQVLIAQLQLLLHRHLMWSAVDIVTTNLDNLDLVISWLQKTFGSTNVDNGCITMPSW
jgi:hypothetical protein